MLRVAPGSVAAKDGSKRKAILQMGDEPIRNIGELSILLITHPPGNTVTVVYFRGNKKRTTQVILGCSQSHWKPWPRHFETAT